MSPSPSPQAWMQISPSPELSPSPSPPSSLLSPPAPALQAKEAAPTSPEVIIRKVNLLTGLSMFCVFPGFERVIENAVEEALLPHHQDPTAGATGGFIWVAIVAVFTFLHDAVTAVSAEDAAGLALVVPAF